MALVCQAYEAGGRIKFRVDDEILIRRALGKRLVVLCVPGQLVMELTELGHRIAHERHDPDMPRVKVRPP